jgi:hypothetical protein
MAVNAADLAHAVRKTKEDHPSGWFFFCKIEPCQLMNTSVLRITTTRTKKFAE